jgi:hypothetical protein
LLDRIEENEYKKIVENEMNKYLSSTNLTIQEILGDTDAFVFGGALRDSIAGVSINDIDIIGYKKSIMDIGDFLIDDGFSKENSDSALDFMYEEFHYFCVSGTYTKNECKIQLIRLYTNNPKYSCHPFSSYFVQNNKFDSEDVKNSVKTIVGNVDIDICGFIYHPYYGFEEVCSDALSNLKKNNFRVLNDNLMHNPGRIETRIKKMEDKGFKHVGEKKKRFNAFGD